MAFNHGKDTVITVAGNNLSAFTDNTEFDDETDVHETTCYGKARKTYIPGLGGGKITISGKHDDTVAGPRKVLKALKNAGTIGAFVLRPNGTGSGKQQSTVNVIVMSYIDTNPVGGVVTWKSVLQMTDTLDETDQP